MKRPTILVTNDDGYFAPGIRKLIDIARDYGDVIVVAPDQGQSGTSHAITIKVPLRLTKLHEEEGYVEYASNGMPVDCVKLAQKVILSERKPDLLLSGINHGSNATVNVLYSGTMAAVLEGCMSQIPSIGFSLDNNHPDADFDPSESYVREIIAFTLKNGMPKDTCLNVNIPTGTKEEIKGMKVCRQGLGYWDESFSEHTDPRKQTYYWLTGKYVSMDEGDDSDEKALEQKYVSVVPMKFDLTDYDRMNYFKALCYDEEMVK